MQRTNLLYGRGVTISLPHSNRGGSRIMLREGGEGGHTGRSHSTVCKAHSAKCEA